MAEAAPLLCAQLGQADERCGRVRAALDDILGVLFPASIAAREWKPLYVALFASSVDTSTPYEPYLLRPDDHPVTAPHGLDREVGVALPALWYFLHLPRIFAEVVDLPYQAVAAIADLRPGHAILLMPVQAFDEGLLPTWPPTGLLPVLMAAPDDLVSEGLGLCSRFEFMLPPISFGSMSDATLSDHWEEIHRRVVPDRPRLGGSRRLSDRLDRAVVELPVQRMAQQIGKPVDTLENADQSRGPWLEECLTQHALVRALSNMEAEQLTEEEAARVFYERVGEEQSAVRIPVTVAAPGVAAPYSRGASAGGRTRQRLEAFDERSLFSADIGTEPDDLVERAAIEFLACHSGVRDGFALMTPTIDAEIFAAFSNIERHWARGPEPRTVLRLLKRLNDLASGLWTEDLLRAIGRASQLIVYSNFPLGILQLPGDTAPLSSRVPISYRPLLPLTRALQTELDSAAVDLSAGFRILIAECIPEDDPVGRLSRDAWIVGRELFDDEAAAASSLVHMEIHSAAELRAAIADVGPDVVVLSAHGASNGNVAGVTIGDDVCLGPELGTVPPVVVLSACHAAVRGRGQVTIADLLLRQGAVAVHAPHVPVDVRRNAFVTVRLFINMALAVAGREPHRTLVDAWRRTQSGNAVLDILNGNPQLAYWGAQLTSRGVPVLLDFMQNASVGKVRTNHAYLDTERVLLEIARDMGVESNVRTWLQQPGYVPESAFYAFMGRPEQVFLQPPAFR